MNRNQFNNENVISAVQFVVSAKEGNELCE